VKRPIVLVLVAMAAGVAHADPPHKLGPGDGRRVIGLVDVHVEGVPAEVASTFQQNIEQQIDTKHFWLAPRVKMKEAMSGSMRWTEGCVVGGCLAEVRSQTGADLALLAALTGSGTSFGYVVTLLRTDTGDVIAQDSDRCDVCTVNEAMTQATLATVKLLNNLPDKLPDEGIERRAAIELAAKAAKVQSTQVAHHGKRIGATLTIVGLAAVAVGAVVYFANNHADSGMVTLAAGGGIAAGGVVVLAF